MSTFISDISGDTFPIHEKVAASSIRPPILKLIQEDYPDFDDGKNLALMELNLYRERYITGYINQEIGELTELEHKVVSSMCNNSTVCNSNVGAREPKPSFGERFSDSVAHFGGSWPFVIIFLSMLVLWIVPNILWLSDKAFDPFPFVMLNLLVSYMASLQAPIILMSQNRQSAKDRQQSKEDYMVNLKAEIEVRTLHEKIDHLMMRQQQRMIEIQQIQIDMLTDIQQCVMGQKKVSAASVKKDVEN